MLGSFDYAQLPDYSQLPMQFFYNKKGTGRNLSLQTNESQERRLTFQHNKNGQVKTYPYNDKLKLHIYIFGDFVLFDWAVGNAIMEAIAFAGSGI